MNVYQLIKRATAAGMVSVFHTTTGARFEVARGLDGNYQAEWYAPGWCLIASHRGLTLREAASLVRRWEAEDEARN